MQISLGILLAQLNRAYSIKSHECSKNMSYILSYARVSDIASVQSLNPGVYMIASECHFTTNR